MDQIVRSHVWTKIGPNNSPNSPFFGSGPDSAEIENLKMDDEEEKVDYSWLVSLPSKVHRSDSTCSSTNSSPTLTAHSNLSAHPSPTESTYKSPLSQSKRDSTGAELLFNFENDMGRLQLSDNMHVTQHQESESTISDLTVPNEAHHNVISCQAEPATDNMKVSNLIILQQLEPISDDSEWSQVMASSQSQWKNSSEIQHCCPDEFGTPTMSVPDSCHSEATQTALAYEDQELSEDPVPSAKQNQNTESAMKPFKRNKVEYNSLIKQAQESETSGYFIEALKYYEKAQEIFDENEKLRKKISKLRTHLAVKRQSILQQITIEMEEDQFVQDGWERDIRNDSYILKDHREFSLTTFSYETLLPYQREGVAWLCGLHFRAQGGILGDDMGLGKTCQTITFVNAAFQCEMIKRVLIVAPVSVLNVWSKEFTKFGEQVASRVLSFYGSNVRERNRNLEYVCAHGGVCLTSYGLCVNNAEKLSETKWDYL
jgi:hypothetical protein